MHLVMSMSRAFAVVAIMSLLSICPALVKEKFVDHLAADIGINMREQSFHRNATIRRRSTQRGGIRVQARIEFCIQRGNHARLQQVLFVDVDVGSLDDANPTVFVGILREQARDRAALRD